MILFYKLDFFYKNLFIYFFLILNVNKEGKYQRIQPKYQLKQPKYTYIEKKYLKNFCMFKVNNKILFLLLLMFYDLRLDYFDYNTQTPKLDFRK